MSRHHRLLTYAAILSFWTILFCGCTTGIHTVKWDSGFAPLAAEQIQSLQKQVNTLSIGQRIAFWAEHFIHAPYDIDPLGEYVRAKKVVCDFHVDCMYLVFRAVELAQANTPEGATDRALDLRFRTRGKIRWGRVINYDERFEYAEDMIDSGRWGREVTEDLGSTVTVPGTRGRKSVAILPRSELLNPETLCRLKSGDLVFFVKDPARRVVNEIVGHLGIIKIENGTVLLVHASGSKTSAEKAGGGMVRKVDLLDYVSNMVFAGAKFTRFE